MEPIVWRKILSDENNTEQPLKIYIGYDSREDIAYEMAKASIQERASVPVDIVPLKLRQLGKDGHYWRGKDKLGSTEFTFSRFLVPQLNEHKGWALFIDCDFIFLDDVANLFDLADDKYAVMCAQHDYTPKAGLKMDGKKQTIYPRKNWSSMMLFNCGHPSNKILTNVLVNDTDYDGKYFHRFSWLEDSEIGKISHEWNWLVGWYHDPEDGIPKALHYTEGGPWFRNYRNCEYNYEWYETYIRYLERRADRAATNLVKERDRIKSVNDLGLPEEKSEIIDGLLKNFMDPEGLYYDTDEEEILEKIKLQKKEPKAAAIDSAGGINYNTKGMVYDEYLEAFIQGTGGRLSNWDREKDTNLPLIIRGLGGGSRKALQHCWETGRTYYAIDTGYFGNGKSKSKGWHRVTKNNLQYLDPIIERDTERLKKIGYKHKKFTDGSKILVCPPSEKVMLLWGQPDPETWVNNVVKELKRYTDRPIEIRLKPNRTERISTKTIEEALADDVHCLVTYNSIAAVEALMNGKPAIALGPNAASVLCNSKLSEVEDLNKPDKDTMIAFMAHLSYCQFNRHEMLNGYAWRVVNESN